MRGSRRHLLDRTAWSRVPGCEIHDEPLARCESSARADHQGGGTGCRSGGRRETRATSAKLATPDVTIADMVGDIDQIKAAQAGSTSRRADDALRMLATRDRGSSPSTSGPILAAVSVDCVTSCRKATSRFKGTQSGQRSRHCGSFTATPTNTRRAARSYADQGSIRIGNPNELHGDNAAATPWRSQQEAWTDRFGATEDRYPGFTSARSSRDFAFSQARSDSQDDKAPG